MKLLIAICLFFCTTLVEVYSQGLNAIDKTVLTFPKSFPDAQKLASKIKSTYQNPQDQVRALYAWIAFNISYDIEDLATDGKSIRIHYRSDAEKIQKQKKILEYFARSALIKQKAVCQGYASLFKVVCDILQIECELISGTAKTSIDDIGRIPKEGNHAWNAVRINKVWKLIDVTWGAGYVDSRRNGFVKRYSDVYFCSKPEMFFMHHFPDNKDWLLISKTDVEFSELPLYHTEYFMVQPKIVEPINGILKPSKDKTIQIVITNPSKEQMSFAINMKKLITVSPQISNNVYTYTIPSRSVKNITVYLNKIPLVTYKVGKK